MSCGPSNIPGSICVQDKPYPIVSAESVPSLIANLTIALYGTITKSLVNGGIVWNIPCDPNNTASITGLPRNPGEGLLCYIIRAMNYLESATPGGVVTLTGVQTLTNKTLISPILTGGTINGAVLNNAALGSGTTGNITGTITSLAGGAVGYIPYQSAVGVTSFIAPPASASNWRFLGSLGGATNPVWQNSFSTNTVNSLVWRDALGNFSANFITASLNGNATTATTATSATTAASATTALGLSSPATGGSPLPSFAIPWMNLYGQLYYISGNTANAGDVLTAQAIGSQPIWTTPSSSSSGSTIVKRDSSGNFSANLITAALNGNAGTATLATNATNLTGATPGSIPWQSASGVTGYTAAGTAGQVLQSNGTSTPTWVTSPPSSSVLIGVTDGSAAAAGYVGEVVTGTGTANGVTSGSFGAAANIYLQPGDWDVFGVAYFNCSSVNTAIGATPAFRAYASTSIDPSSLPSGLIASTQIALSSATAPFSIVVPMRTVSISVATLYYIGVAATFSAGTVTTSTSSYIYARRRR